MAPMALSKSHPLKRTSSQAQFDIPPSKKVNRGSLRHHKARWDPQRAQRKNGVFQDETSVQDMLTRSIGLALEAVGFEAARPEAIESFRLDVEEYMAHYLADVRQSMLSSRRTQILPGDFLQALHTHQLSLSSLLPHLDPPVPPQKSQSLLPLYPPLLDDQQGLRALSLILNGPNEQVTKNHIPGHFPSFPSKHTYKATPDFPKREHDPRRVREQATEEGRFGEEALRRLVAKSSVQSLNSIQPNQKTLSIRAKRAQLWKETMQAVTQDEGEAVGDTMDGVEKEKQRKGDPAATNFGNGRIGLAVNAEKRYWRKPAPQRRGVGD